MPTSLCDEPNAYLMMVWSWRKLMSKKDMSSSARFCFLAVKTLSKKVERRTPSY